MTTNDGGADQYIGQPLSELPDGTVAVVQYADSGSDVYIRTKGGFATASKHGDEWVPWCDHGNGDGVWPTVVHVIKLGKPRPRTLDEAEPGEVWRSAATGRLWWRDRESDNAMTLDVNGVPFESVERVTDVLITEYWTRLGKITGIVIDGKVYGKEATDE